MTDITPEIHRKLAASLFNKTWELIDLKERTTEDTELMVNSAHASLFHWLQVGNAVNFARGEWQISRVYSLCKRAEPALHHAENCLRICLENHIGDFDLAFAYEALARACNISDASAKSQQYLELAREAAQNIKEKDNREYLLTELSTITL